MRLISFVLIRCHGDAERHSPALTFTLTFSSGNVNRLASIRKRIYDRRRSRLHSPVAAGTLRRRGGRRVRRRSRWRSGICCLMCSDRPGGSGTSGDGQSLTDTQISGDYRDEEGRGIPADLHDGDRCGKHHTFRRCF